MNVQFGFIKDWSITSPPFLLSATTTKLLSHHIAKNGIGRFSFLPCFFKHFFSNFKNSWLLSRGRGAVFAVHTTKYTNSQRGARWQIAVICVGCVLTSVWAVRVKWRSGYQLSVEALNFSIFTEQKLLKVVDLNLQAEHRRLMHVEEGACQAVLQTIECKKLVRFFRSFFYSFFHLYKLDIYKTRHWTVFGVACS